MSKKFYSFDVEDWDSAYRLLVEYNCLIDLDAEFDSEGDEEFWRNAYDSAKIHFEKHGFASSDSIDNLANVGVYLYSDSEESITQDTDDSCSDDNNQVLLTHVLKESKYFKKLWEKERAKNERLSAELRVCEDKLTIINAKIEVIEKYVAKLL